MEPDRVVGPDTGRQSDYRVTSWQNIQAGDACYIDGNDLVYRSIGASSGASANVRGFAVADATRDEAVALAFDVTMRYGDDLLLGESLYLPGTVVGGLADCPSPGGVEPIAWIVDATSIHTLQN